MQERNNRSSRQHEIWTRVISLLLSTLMIISIAGCGTTPDAEPTSEPTQSTAPTTPAVEQPTEPVEAEVPTGTVQDENADATEVETAPIETEAVEPEVILMDEPTSALDPISTSKIEDLAVELRERYTIVMVTHNMQQATRISDYTAFFLLGEMVEYDKTETLFSIPKDKRTEDYITGRFG